MSYQEVAAEILDCPLEEVGDCLFIPQEGTVLFPNDIQQLRHKPEVSFEVEATLETIHITITTLVNGQKKSIGKLNIRYCL